MGYQVRYPGSDPKTPRAYGRGKKLRTAVTGLLIASLFGSAMIPVTREMLIDCLVPGDTKITTAAVECFLRDVKQGEALDEAVTAFCEVVLYGRQ